MSRFGTNIPRFVRTLLVGVGLLALAGLFITPLISKPAYAAPGINKMINFQGKVVNSDGTNVPNGTYSFVFKIWDAASVGTTLWTETQSSVTVTNGIFQVELGSVTALPGSVNFNTDNLYLSLNFNADGDMSPRIRFDAVPYAFNSDKLNGLSSTQFVRTDAASTVDVSSTTALVLQNTATNVLFVADTTNQKVGVGAAPTAGGSTLQVTGTITSTGTITVGTNTSLSTTTLTIGGTGVCTVSGCTPVTNSGSYIQNTTIQQASSNFNISGNGTIGGVATVGSLTTTGNISAGTVNAKGYATTNTSSTFSGQYTKLGSCTITAQFQDCSSEAEIVNTSDGLTGNYHATVGFRVKQQNAMGGLPGIALEVWNVRSITANQFVAVTTQNDGAATVVGVYAKINQGFQSWSIEPIINAGTAVVWVGGQGFSVSLPAGAQNAAVYSDGKLSTLNITPTADTTTAFQVQTASTYTTLLAVDTTNVKVSNAAYTSLTGGLTVVALSTPAAPTITNVGTAGTTSYSYTVTARNGNGGETVASTAGSTTTGNATLDGTNYNTITWTPVSGAKDYRIYRTASAGTPATTGLIGTVGGSTLTLNDTALAAGAAAPTVDGSGRTGLGAAPANGVLTVGGNTTSASGGLYFGTDANANLYRSGTNALTTAGSLSVGTTGSTAVLNIVGATGTTPVVNVNTSAGASTDMALIGFNSGRATFGYDGGNSSALVASSGGKGVIFQTNASVNNVLSLGVNGNATFKNTANTTTGFLVQNANATTNMIAADTTNIQITNIGFTQLTGGLTVSSISAPGTPTITNGGTAGTTTYSYTVTARTANGNETTSSSAGTTATGNATLDVTNFNTITWTVVPGAKDYRVYRTAAGGTPATTGLIGTVINPTLTLNDTGLAASSASPGTNSTGNVSLGASLAVTGTTTLTGSLTVNNTAQTGNLTVGNTANQQITLSAGAGNHGIEIGRIDTVTSTPFIDFHSGATAVDYDTRIISSGGTGSSGAGTLTFQAATTSASGIFNAASLQTGSTTRIDSSGNLSNIGTITSGLINGQTISSAANFTGTVTVATSLTTPILQSASGATLLVDSGTTGALNIGTGANAKTVTIGNATGATAVNIQSGTGGITLTPVGTSNSGVLVKPTNNSTSAFQVQSSTGYQLVNVDSTFPASNLITNPGFEVNTTGWSNKGTGALTRITSPASSLYYGVGAGSLAMTAANDGVAFSVSTTVGTTYSLSFYAKSSSGVTANLAAGYTNGSGDNNCTLSATTVSTAGFQRYSCSFSVATTNGTAVYVKQTTAQSMTIIIDASMLVSGTSAVTPYGISNIALRGTIVNPMVFQSASDSTTALQIQNAAGTSNLLVADSLNTRIGIGNATPAYTLDVSGDVNTTGAYRINGTPIASSNLSNDANLAKLNGTGPQTFTGNNKFTGTLLAQNAADSTTAFQIQNAAGTSNLLLADTTNTRIGIGAIPANGTLTVGTNTTVATGGLYFGTDTNLYRSAASTMRTDGSIQALGNIQSYANGTLLQASLTSGSLTGYKSDGSSVAYKLDNSDAATYRLQVHNQAAATVGLRVDNWTTQTGDWLQLADSVGSRLIVSADGSINSWGSTGIVLKNGTGAFIARDATNTSATTFATRAAADSSDRLTVYAGGQLNWGPGNATTDTNLYRSAASTLKTDSSFVAQTAVNNPLAFLVENSTGANVPINVDTVNNIFTSNAQYTTGGTISQSTTTVTGVGTAFGSGMVGGTLIYADTTTATVTAVASTTSLTVSVSKSVASTATYYIRWGGLTVTSTGATSVQTTTNSTTAFQIQNAAGTSNLLLADTTNTRIGIGAIPANGTLTVGTNTTAATGGLYLGTDTNLYRSAASTLKTDDNLYSSVIGSNSGAAREIGFTDTATAGSYYRFALDGSNGFQSGNAQNAKLYSYWGLVLQGSRQTVGAPTFVAGAVSDPSVTVLSGGTAQSVLVVKGAVSQTATLLEVQDSTGAPALSVGATGATTFKNIANSIAALSVQNAAGTSIFNVDTTNSKIGTVNTTAGSTNSQALNIKSGDASGATSNSGDVTLDSGTATGTAGNLNIGTGAYAHNTTIGNSTGSTGVTLQGGTGASAISVQSAASGTISIGTVGVANTVQIGNTSGAVSQTINLGTNAVASSNTAITLGSTIGTSPVTIQSGTSGITATSTSTSGSLFTVSGSTSVAALRVVNSGLGPHIQSANGSGTNVQGANLSLAAGQGTGSGIGGSLNLQVATTGASGSSLNNLATVFTISPGSGSGFYMPITDTANTFVVRNASNIDFFNIDTLNKKINIGIVDNVGALLVLDTDNDATLANGVSTNASAEIDGAMFYNSTNATFECGQAGVWVSCIGGLLSSNTSVSTAVNNTATETPFNLSYTLPAGYCTAGRVIRWTASGKYSSTGQPTLIMKMRTSTAVTLAGNAANPMTVGSTQTNLGWRLEGETICNAAPGGSVATESDGIIRLFNTTTGAISADLTTTAATNLATNGNLTLQISVQWGTAAVGNTITMRQFIIEGLGP